MAENPVWQVIGVQCTLFLSTYAALRQDIAISSDTALKVVTSGK